jgi:hypothetical protein
MVDQTGEVGFEPSHIMPAIRALEHACTEAVESVVPEGHVCGVIHVTKDQWAAQEGAFSAREQFFAEMMPTERDAIEILHAAYSRLKKLGWSDAIYCPKDGSEFDAIEAGSTGIHKCHYSGEWPDGSWWIAEAGDLWPSRPILYRRTPVVREALLQGDRS